MVVVGGGDIALGTLLEAQRKHFGCSIEAREVSLSLFKHS